MRRYSITRTLNLPEYKIAEIISETDKEIHIRVEPYKRKGIKCGGCGEEHKRSRHSQEETIAQDKPISGLRVYLHVIKRLYKCPVDGRIYVEEITWLKKWSRVTKRFAEQVNRLTAITTNQEAGWFLGLDDETVYRI
ncbi:transposase family protein, partial [bacterium]|nr:transposase family protein [bacterium]MBU1782743.1 transposase family protein [bacterium]